MNVLKLPIDDYLRETTTLSLAEQGAYWLMLQHYCHTERPLPEGKALRRLLRADNKEEFEAIDRVVEQYWAKTEAGLTHLTSAEAISLAQAQASTNRRIAKQRVALRKRARMANDQQDAPSTCRPQTIEPIAQRIELESCNKRATKPTTNPAPEANKNKQLGGFNGTSSPLPARNIEALPSLKRIDEHQAKAGGDDASEALAQPQSDQGSGSKAKRRGAIKGGEVSIDTESPLAPRTVGSTGHTRDLFEPAPATEGMPVRAGLRRRFRTASGAGASARIRHRGVVGLGHPPIQLEYVTKLKATTNLPRSCPASRLVVAQRRP